MNILKNRKKGIPKMSKSKLQLPQLRKRLIDNRIDFLARYSESLERMLQKQTKLFGETHDNRARLLPEDERNEFLENFAEEYQELASHFPSQVRYGVVIAAYGLLENEFLSAAKKVKASRKIALSVADLRGDPISRAWMFMTKVAEMPLPQKLWDSIQPYRLLRNLIAHERGQLPDEPKRKDVKCLTDFISRSSTLTIDSQRTVVLSEAFAEEFLTKIRSFYAELYECWTEWLKIKPVPATAKS